MAYMMHPEWRKWIDLPVRMLYNVLDQILSAGRAAEEAGAASFGMETGECHVKKYDRLRTV